MSYREQWTFHLKYILAACTIQTHGPNRWSGWPTHLLCDWLEDGLDCFCVESWHDAAILQVDNGSKQTKTRWIVVGVQVTAHTLMAPKGHKSSARNRARDEVTSLSHKHENRLPGPGLDELLAELPLFALTLATTAWHLRRKRRRYWQRCGSDRPTR